MIKTAVSILERQEAVPGLNTASEAGRSRLGGVLLDQWRRTGRINGVDNVGGADVYALIKSIVNGACYDVRRGRDGQVIAVKTSDVELQPRGLPLSTVTSEQKIAAILDGFAVRYGSHTDKLLTPALEWVKAVIRRTMQDGVGGGAAFSFRTDQGTFSLDLSILTAEERAEFLRLVLFDAA